MGLLAKVYRGNELLHTDALSTALVQEGDVFLSLLIRNITVVNGNGRDEQVDVWMKDGKIAQIAPQLDIHDVEQLDGSGKFLLPGFIDMHIHGSLKWIRWMLLMKGFIRWLNPF